MISVEAGGFVQWHALVVVHAAVGLDFEAHHNQFLSADHFFVVSVQNLINVNELDPIRRYLPAAERPRPSSRYSSFQVSVSLFLYCSPL